MTHIIKTFLDSRCSPSYLSEKRESKKFQAFHNKNHRYSCLDSKTPMELISSTDYNPRTLGANTKLPNLDYIPGGKIILIRFIRSDRKLDIFSEKFSLSDKLVYSYVKAEIDTTSDSLAIYLGDELSHEFEYRLMR